MPLAAVLLAAAGFAARAETRPVLAAPELPASSPAPVRPGGPSDRAIAPIDRIEGTERIEPIERTEREVDARRLRGAPVLPAVPRIGAEPPVEPVPARIPRIAVPGPGEPGGPPIALPTCGAAGCFDAGGRPLSGGGAVLTTPDGRPCIRIGAAASCQ